MSGAAALWPCALILRLVAACPQGWIRGAETTCLRVFEGPANWDEAKASCENRGAQLASIHSQAENDQCIFACGNVRPFHQGCWLGGTDRHQRKNKWIWVDGTPFNWTRWNMEPNNDFCTDHRHCTYGHTADCNVLEVSKPFRGHWLDTFCTDRQKFICKVNETAPSALLNEDVEKVVPSPRSRLPSPPPPRPPPNPVPAPARRQSEPPETSTKEEKVPTATDPTPSVADLTRLESSQMEELQAPSPPETLDVEPKAFQAPSEASDATAAPGAEDESEAGLVAEGEDFADDVYQ